MHQGMPRNTRVEARAAASVQQETKNLEFLAMEQFGDLALLVTGISGRRPDPSRQMALVDWRKPEHGMLALRHLAHRVMAFSGLMADLNRKTAGLRTICPVWRKSGR